MGIKDTDTKKRFTILVNEKTKPNGLKILNTLKKKDRVEGRYTVTGAGLYIALELMKKKFICWRVFLVKILGCLFLLFRRGVT